MPLNHTGVVFDETAIHSTTSLFQVSLAVAEQQWH